MDVGVVGLGDIATKAYLPVLATTPGVRLHLASRDADAVAAAAERFHAVSTHRDITGVLDHDLDAVFVTAATPAHAELVSAALDAGVAVHVDKPIAPSAAEAASIIDLARTSGTPLAVGFNRRFAPVYRRLAAVSAPSLVLLHKHRPDHADDVRRAVFDDLIHVLDTLRWLLPDEPTEVDVAGRVVDGRLHHVVVTLGAGGRHAVGTMNRVSGATTETLEVQSAAATVVVHDVARVEERRDGRTTWDLPGNWEPMLRVRGFEAMLDDFLGSVVGGGRPLTRSLDDLLATHELCETVVDRLGAINAG